MLKRFSSPILSPTVTVFVLFTLILTFSFTPAQALQCRQVFQRNIFASKSVKVIENWGVVEQCSGTCYFESTVAHLEGILSRHHKQPVLISRTHLFAFLALSRMIEFVNKKNNEKIITPEEMDFVKSGYTEEVMSLVKKYGVLLLGHYSRRQEFVSIEDLTLRIYYQQVRDLLDRYYQGSLTKAELATQVKEVTSSSIKEIKDHALLPVTLPGVRDNRLKIHNFKIHQIKDTTGIMEKLRQAIDHNHTLILTFYVRKYDEINSNGEYHQGKVTLGKKVEQGSGFHAALVVGYTVNHQNQITHITIRNSWGENSGDRGHIHMPVDLFLKRFWQLEYVEILNEKK